MSFFTKAGRVVAWAGLTAVGGLHVVWAAGFNWPAKNRRELASATVGNMDAMPDAWPTALVAGVAFGASAVAAGALGESGVAVSMRRVIGATLLARAVAGGSVALRVLGLGSADKRFQRLDSLYFRPFCAALGLAVLVGARR